MKRLGMAAALLLAGAMPALPADLPHRKPGLWVVKTTLTIPRSQQGATTRLFCVDAATDEATLMFFPVSDCPKINTRSPNTVTIDVTCGKADKMTAHAVIRGSFDSAYTMTLTVQGEMGFHVQSSTMTTRSAATWLGPCTAGQEPGDMINPATGAKLNIPEMFKAKNPLQ